MKIVEAILAPHRLDDVKELLIRRGCEDIIVSEVRNANGPTLRYRGVSYTGEACRLKVEAPVEDSDAMATAEAILDGSPEYAPTDERVTIHPLDDVISIGSWKIEPSSYDSTISRTGESCVAGRQRAA